MATVIKTWSASTNLVQTPNFGGVAAVVAADGQYDYTGNVDLRTTGIVGAHVQISMMPNNRYDDLVIEVRTSFDGSVYDTEPYATYRLKNGQSPAAGVLKRLSFIVEGPAMFRLALKSSSTNTQFEYQVTYQTWILTNA